MNHLDITIDFETCAMTASAAVMQVAMVPWLRDNEEDPFCNEQEVQPFVGHVDLRTCVVEGFDFDQETIKWWSERNDKAKEAVVKGEPLAIEDVLMHMLNYIYDMKVRYELTSICVWCQGMDFDIAILRNLCRKYGVDLEEDIPHTQFRDCRTVILEAALREATRSMQGKSTRANGIVLPDQILAGNYDTYKMFAPLPDRYIHESEAHDALYDALCSSWNTWQALRWLNE